jgi:hypothetical protein
MSEGFAAKYCSVLGVTKTLREPNKGLVTESNKNGNDASTVIETSKAPKRTCDTQSEILKKYGDRLFNTGNCT